MGAGVLPVAIHQNRLYFLFGQEQDTKEWSDFGGGSEPGETARQTAIREATEELNGFYGDRKGIERMLQKQLVAKLSFDRYTTFLVNVTYDPVLPTYFANNHAYMRAYLPKQVGEDGMFEKRQITWFTVGQLRQRQHEFRGFYQKIVQLLLQPSTLQDLRACFKAEHGK
jgi:8-oxo-dGTP pyrophosphatase MutT (NUDIX family)